MLLANKVAVVYGAGGAIGSAVALAFAREGARIFLAGRSRAKLERVAEEIRAKGGTADTAIVDALDEKAVDAVCRSCRLAGREQSISRSTSSPTATFRCR